ncbi:MAG TPA: YaaL family protein [Oscillospiraceae bacterium]|nr:YaaL family protein [Oscillospiraceae bacterium]
MEEKEITRKKEKNIGSLVSALGNLYNRISQTKDQKIDESEELVQCVIKAHEEWQNAEIFFHSVSDPDLIDHAIYRLEASKARYIYLLKQAKIKGVRINLH